MVTGSPIRHRPILVWGVPVRGNSAMLFSDPDRHDTDVEFPFVCCDGESAVFENTDRDFPQRPPYRTNDPGRLEATVKDLEGQGFDLSFMPDDP